MLHSLNPFSRPSRSLRKTTLRNRSRRPCVDGLERRVLLTIVNINPYVNANVQTYTNGSNFPAGGATVTVDGVAFTLAKYTGGGTGVIQTPDQSTPSSFDVPVDIANPTTVYTLINSIWGDYGANDGAVEFKATGGLDYTVNLVEGQDVRDFNNDGYNDTIGLGPWEGSISARRILAAVRSASTHRHSSCRQVSKRRP